VKVDQSKFKIGDEWVYRLRDYAPSERVQIQAITPINKSVRVEVVFVDDPERRVENVPGSRLRVPWKEVVAYETLMAQWKRIDNLALDTTEQSCAEEAFDLLIPEEVAAIEWKPVRNVAALRDVAKLEELLGDRVEKILDGVERFDLGGVTMLAPAGTLRIAEAACRANPAPILDRVSAEETEARSRCTHGSEHINASTRETVTTPPECEYLWYREIYLPRHELFRQWCGHRAVTQQERLQAAEAEVRRLDILVAKVIQALTEAGAEQAARTFTEEHERDRITPYTVRPSVDEPASPPGLLKENAVRECGEQ
jgi:hypothetical protein